VDHENIYIDSHHLSNYSIGRPLNASPPAAPELQREKSIDLGLTHVTTPASPMFANTVHDIAIQLRNHLGVSLFGFDLIQPSTSTPPSSSTGTVNGSSDETKASSSTSSSSSSTSIADYYIVDVNHFPSYDGVSHFPQKLLNFLCDHWRTMTSSRR
jgi:hypothetical protein